MARDVSELAYDLSLRTLAQQEGAVNELRARTGTLLTASAIVASFLGATAVATPGHGWLTALGFASFAVSVCASAYVLWPKRALVFAGRSTAVFGEDSEETLGEMQRRLASWFEAVLEANEPVIDWLSRAYRIATISVLLQAGIWLLKVGVS